MQPIALLLAHVVVASIAASLAPSPGSPRAGVESRAAQPGRRLMALGCFRLKQQVLVGHDVYVFRVGCNCDATALAAATSENSLGVFDPESLKLLRTLDGHGDMIEDILRMSGARNAPERPRAARRGPKRPQKSPRTVPGPDRPNRGPREAPEKPKKGPK